MAEKFSGDMEEYVIEYSKILNSPGDFTASTRLLAAELMQNPYKSIGDYLKALTDSDISLLIEKIDADDLEEVLLISEMLARAEGVVTNTMEDVTKNVNTMSIFIVCESLFRKQMIELYHEYLSLGDDYGDKVVMRRKQ